MRTIKSKRVILAGTDLDVLTIVKLDAHRISFHVFGYEDWGDDFLTPAELAPALNDFAPVGIIYYSKIRNRRVHGEDLSPALAGQTLYGIGEYCLDLSPDNALSGMVSPRHDKQMFIIYYDNNTRAIRPMNVYPETSISKGGRYSLNSREQSLVLAQIRLPFANSTMDDAHIRLYSYRPLVLGEAKKFETPADNLKDYYKPIMLQKACDGFPHLRLSGPATIEACLPTINRILQRLGIAEPTDADLWALGLAGEAELKIELVNHLGKSIAHPDVYVYIKSDAGILPRNKITLSSITGRGTIRIRADNIPVGESITVKIGFKHYSNAAQHTLKIIPPKSAKPPRPTAN